MTGFPMDEGNQHPWILLVGDNGWQLDNWRVTQQQDEISYTFLGGIASPCWLDSEDDNDWNELHIDPWSNPYTHWQSVLQSLLDGFRALRSSLTAEGGYCLRERMDEILDPVIKANADFLMENYPAAVEKYHTARNLLSLVSEGDRVTDPYSRMHYILSLHIGDCYRGHREYERAVNHFLTHTASYRREDTFDDCFLWNHVAACVLDWADHRYRAAGGDKQKRRYFDDIEAVADPIDSEHPFTQSNTQGAYDLYRQVLNRGFVQEGTALFDWHAFFTALFVRYRITSLVFLVGRVADIVVSGLSGYIRDDGRPPMQLEFDYGWLHATMQVLHSRRPHSLLSPWIDSSN